MDALSAVVIEKPAFAALHVIVPALTEKAGLASWSVYETPLTYIVARPLDPVV